MIQQLLKFTVSFFGDIERSIAHLHSRRIQFDKTNMEIMRKFVKDTYGINLMAILPKGNTPSWYKYAKIRTD